MFFAKEERQPSQGEETRAQASSDAPQLPASAATGVQITAVPEQSGSPHHSPDVFSGGGEVSTPVPCYAAVG